jgi:hypothetical protein
MAYTIQFLKGGIEKRDRVLADLNARLAKDGRFRCTFTLGEVKTTRQDRTNIAGLYRAYSLPSILVGNVRLTEKKPYCGNHPGECPVGSPKPNSTRLEWDDWVTFHGLVNRSLNKFKADANVWSLPYDVKGRMWIRRGRQARLRYDWTETTDGFSRNIRIWNQGTPDQFTKETA